MFTIDAHLDLAMNAMEWNRDLRMSIHEIRAREKNLKDKPDRGNNLISFEELRKGDIGLVVTTQLARYVEPGNPLPGWNSAEQAWAHTQGQLAWYKSMEASGEITQISDRRSLDKHVTYWRDNTQSRKSIGYILSLEGADSIVDLSYLETAYNYGLRAIGPAHFGPGRYAFGTGSNGGVTTKGKELLKEMKSFNFILDMTHLCDESFWQAVNTYKGPIWASHNNCRALANTPRQFTDDQLKILIDRGAVIGAVMHCGMIVNNWQKGVSDPRANGVNLERVIDHMDHICQLAGNANHIGIGSDIDGGFGKEESPYDLETIADVSILPDLLKKRGYADSDIEGIMHGNFLRFLQNHLPA